MKSYEKWAIVACLPPALFFLSAVLYYPLLVLGEWLGLWGDPPKDGLPGWVHAWRGP